jgi:hypothetical protein
MKFSLVILGAMAILFSSCSSVVNGTKQMVSIDSNVKGAEVNVDGYVVGKTPFNGKITRGSDTVVTLKKEGYNIKTIVLSQEITPAFWGNGLFFYFFPFSSTTDGVNGAMYKYSPATYNIDMDPLSAGK